jgi:hypothetical protein
MDKKKGWARVNLQVRWMLSFLEKKDGLGAWRGEKEREGRKAWIRGKEKEKQTPGLSKRGNRERA